MEKTTVYLIVAICVIITFIVPLIQLGIGFKYVVKDGKNPNYQCEAAPDLPLLMAIGGIFALFFLGTAYGFLKMVSSVDETDSDIAGKTPKILVGCVSFTFGAITFIFFILMQIRVYGAYSNGVQFNTQPATNYCRSAVMRGGLAMIILTYLNILLLIGIFALILVNTQNKRQAKRQAEMEMVETNNTYRH